MSISTLQLPQAFRIQPVLNPQTGHAYSIASDGNTKSTPIFGAVPLTGFSGHDGPEDPVRKFRKTGTGKKAGALDMSGNVGYGQVPGGTWEALDTLSSLKMGTTELVQSYIERFFDLINRYDTNLKPLPQALIAHHFVKGMRRANPSLYQAAKYFMTNISPQSTWNNLLHHLIGVEKTIQAVSFLNEQAARKKQEDLRRKVVIKGWEGKGREVEIPIAYQDRYTSPESDTRTRIRSWKVPSIKLSETQQAEARRQELQGRGQYRDIDMEPVTPKYCGAEPPSLEVRLPPLWSEGGQMEESSFSTVEIEAVKIMMLLGQRG